MARKSEKSLLSRMIDGDQLSFSQQLLMIVQLSIPAILAQISNIIMQYIDASMVGRLGASDSASIGLVSSTTWLFGGLCTAAATGFTVKIAHRCGAKELSSARNIMKLGLVCTAIFGVILLILGASLSPILPRLLGGEESIRQGASLYFLIFALSLPFYQLNCLCAGALQCSGNMKLPGLLEVIMCVLDVVFNALLIFPTATHTVFGMEITLPGAGLGIVGAALGTALSEAVIALFMLWYLLFRSKTLKLRKDEKLSCPKGELRSSLKIALPVAAEQAVTCTAYIMFTRIVAPLGTAAVAANSFSITAESLCYMPGYGIGAAAVTIIGQALGAKRIALTKHLGRMTVWLGVIVMTLGGVLMYFVAPAMLGVLTPDPEIQAMGVTVLRIEAFAEPMYAASIVATGVFRGAGDTGVPTAINFISMWLVRIPLAYVLSLSLGLSGVWIAMACELCLRGLLFIILFETRFRKRADSGRYLINSPKGS